MSSYEKLGIQIDFEFAKGLADAVKKIQDAFGKIDVSKLTAKTEDLDKKFKKLSESIAKLTGGNANQIQLDIKDSSFNKKMADATKLIENYKNVAVDANGKIVSVFKETNAALKEQERIAREVSRAWSQRSNEMGLGGGSNKANEIERAYQQQARQNKATVAEELRIAKERANIYKEDERLREQRLNKLSTLQKKEETIQAARERNDKRELESLLRKIDAEKRADRLDQERVGSGLIASGRRQGLVWDNGQLVKPIKEIKTELDKAAKSSDAFKGSLLQLINLEARFYAVRAVLFGLSSQFREAVSSILDLNQALADTAAISNASVSSMIGMEVAALNIARNSKFTSAEIAESMKTLAQAGVSAQDIPDVTKTSTLFATGTGATPQQSVDLLTTAMNVWKVEAKDSATVANIFTAALNQSKLEAGQLGTVFNYLANQASVAGLSLEETAGIVAQFSQQGLKASTIGTSVSLLLTRLMAPTPKFKKMLDEFGISLSDINPRIHTFGEVISVFEKKSIPVEKILSSLEQRAGRALVTAISAGGLAFDRMTQNVTGTNAVLVANQKAMEGARAKLNVLKQEFTLAIKQVGEKFTPAITVAFGALTDLVKGLQTSAGQFVVVSLGIAAVTTALISMGKALFALKVTNPELFALSLTLGGLALAATAVVGALGRFNEGRKIEEQIKGVAKGFIDSAEATQRKSAALVDLQTELIKTNKHLATSKNPKAEYVKLSDEAREKIKAHANEYPALLKFLTQEKTLYGDIIELQEKLNLQKKFDARQAARQYNDIIRQANKEINDAELRQRTAGDREAVKQRIKLKVQAADEQLKPLFANQGFIQAGDGTFTEIATPKLAPRSGSVLDDVDEKAAKAAVKLEKKMNEFDILVEKWKSNNLAKINDNEFKQLELIYKDATKSIEERKEAFYKALHFIDQEEINKFNKDIVELNSTFADKHELKFNVEKNKFEGKWSEKTAEDYKQYLEAFGIRKDLLDIESITKQQQALGQFDKTDVKAENIKLTSDYYEKQFMKQMMVEENTNKIRKDQAKTAEEIRDINLEALNNQIHMNLMLAEKYQNDLKILNVNEDALQKKLEEGEILSANEQKYINIQEKAERITEQLKEQNAQLRQQQDTSFQGNFMKGVYTANKGFGTNEERTQALGSQITNTLGDGLTSTIDNMITALAKGENAWRSFRDGIGGILKDIAGELQKYIAKMIAVWVVQKLIGLAMSGSGSGDINLQSNGMGGMTNVTGSDVGGGFDFSAWANSAEGGQVVGGIPGVDSVPKMLMPDEWVIKASSVRKYGSAFMRELNEGRVQKLADGGGFGGTSAGTSASTAIPEELNLTIINVTDSRDLANIKTSEREIINVLHLAVDRRDPIVQKLKLRLREN